MGLLLDLLVGRLVRRLDGPTVAFKDPGALGRAPVPPAGPTPATGAAGADRAPGSNPGSVGAADKGSLVESEGVGFPQAHTSTWPVGAGRRANDCLFLDDPSHRCLNSYGEPVRAGGSCYHSARIETLRSYTQRRPNSWLTQVVSADVEAVVR